VVAGLLAAGCSSGGGKSSAPTTSTVPTTAALTSTTGGATTVASTTTAPVKLPAGFEPGIVEVTLADGRTIELCVLLATNERQRGQGLMSVTGLGRYAGMLFAFPATTETSFYMLDTVIPLSIAWFAEDGTFVSATDMQPCLTADASGCPLYGATGPYLNAIEVPLGDLNRLGIGEGSSLTVTDRSC
jgi:uncharacterized protein